MLRKLMRRRWVAALGVVAALGIAGAAVAYFTAGGSGSGSATVGSVTSSDIVITGNVASGSYLFPGGSPVTVPLTVKNNSSTAVKVGTVSLTNITADASHSTCDVGITGANPAFTMAAVPVNQTVSANQTINANGSLQMNDTGVSQDACQGATLTLTFTSTAGS